MRCPKCGFPRQPGSDECPKCGIIYDKYKEYSQREQTGDVKKAEGEEKKEKKEIKKLVNIFLKKLAVKERISQLTNLQITALILFAVFLTIGIGFIIYTPDITIDGEISIDTKGGQSIKPGQIKVNAFSKDALLPYLYERRKERDAQLWTLWKEIKAAKTEYDAAFQQVEYAFRWDFDKTDEALKAREAAKRKWLRLRAEEREIDSCGFFFQELPAPLTSTKTNSEGKFNIRVPGSGLHVIAASAERQVSDDAEKYYWIREINPKNGRKQTLVLSNDNLASPDDIIDLINNYARE